MRSRCAFRRGDRPARVVQSPSPSSQHPDHRSVPSGPPPWWNCLSTFALFYVSSRGPARNHGTLSPGIAIGFTCDRRGCRRRHVPAALFTRRSTLVGATAGLFAWVDDLGPLVLPFGAGSAAGRHSCCSNPRTGLLRTTPSGPQQGTVSGRLGRPRSYSTKEHKDDKHTARSTPPPVQTTRYRLPVQSDNTRLTVARASHPAADSYPSSKCQLHRERIRTPPHARAKAARFGIDGSVTGDVS